MRKSNFILGDKVEELEKKIANYVGVDECITCASGTDALLIPLMAHKISKGHAVITTNFSFFATTEVISLVGATPVFVDIDETTFNINPDLLELQINKTYDEGKYIPKAIIAVDLFGQLADYDKIEKIAKKYNLLLIEDACQSFGASYNDKKSCSFGNVGATSFFPAKPLGCYGDGGAIFTNDKDQAALYRSIRVHGQGADRYDNVRIGLNSRLDTIQASVLLNKLKIFDNELKKRQEIAKYYTDGLKEFLVVPSIKINNISSWAQYSLLAKNKSHRNDILKLFKNNNIPTAIYYNKIFSEIDFYKNNNNTFPVSKSISEKIFSIPMHPYLTTKEMDKIINLIKDFHKQ